MSDVIYSGSVGGTGMPSSYTGNSSSYSNGSSSHHATLNGRAVASQEQMFSGNGSSSHLGYFQNVESGQNFNFENLLDKAYKINYTNSYENYRRNMRAYDKYDERNYRRYLDSFERLLELENNSMQRRVADLKAAGINPLLAIRLGGAGVPNLALPYANLSMPMMQNITYDPSGVMAAAASMYASMIGAENNIRSVSKDYEAISKDYGVAEEYNATSRRNATLGFIGNLLVGTSILASNLIPKLIKPASKPMGFLSGLAMPFVPKSLFNSIMSRNKDF